MKRAKTIPASVQVTRQWYLVDLSGKVLGRAATMISSLLIGKQKPFYSPHVDCGDYVVVINAKDVCVTGRKEEQKLYRHHTGYPGGFREKLFSKLRQEDPCRIVELAVSGMIPKNKLRELRLRRLKIFADGTHPYQEKFKGGATNG